MRGLDTLVAIANGDISAREACADSMARIARCNQRVNAFTLTTRDRAFAEADEVDKKRARGERLPPLAGLPYAVKNLFDIEGETTLAGSKVNRTLPAAASDAFLVARMREAGAVLVGALNMDEYAYGFTTENTHYGTTRNPHDLTCVAGGSSGGSGAAVAAALVPVALGSDTNGSIRVPASLCGVWGLKPTFGRLSRRGAYPFVHSLDHVGPMADSVGTLALAYDALQGPDTLDSSCHATHAQPVAQTADPGVHGLRIGTLGGYFEEMAGPEARVAAQLAGRALSATGEVTWPDAELARAAAFIVTASEGGQLHLPILRSMKEEFEPLSVDRLIAGAMQPVAWYLAAQRFRRTYRERVMHLFKDWES